MEDNLSDIAQLFSEKDADTPDTTKFVENEEVETDEEWGDMLSDDEAYPKYEVFNKGTYEEIREHVYRNNVKTKILSLLDQESDKYGRVLTGQRKCGDKVNKLSEGVVVANGDRTVHTKTTDGRKTFQTRGDPKPIGEVNSKEPESMGVTTDKIREVAEAQLIYGDGGINATPDTSCEINREVNPVEILGTNRQPEQLTNVHRKVANSVIQNEGTADSEAYTPQEEEIMVTSLKLNCRVMDTKLRQLKELHLQEKQRRQACERENVTLRSRILDVQDELAAAKTVLFEARKAKSARENPDDGRMVNRYRGITHDAKVCELKYDNFEQILLEEDEDQSTPDTIPILQISVGGLVINAIVDSGSELTAISEEFFHKCDVNTSLPVLKTRRVRVHGPIIGKSTEITRQTRITFECQGHILETNFVIIPRLSVSVIIGSDFLLEEKAVLDMGNGKIQLRNHTLKFCDRDRAGNLPKNFTQLHLERVGDVFTDMDYEESRADGDIDPETLSLIRDGINRKTDEIRGITPEHRAKLREILHEHGPVFEPKTGAIKNFVYKFAVREHKPFRVAPYSIPMSYRGEVQAELKRMESEGIVELGTSAYNSPLLLVKKKGGAIRLVLDSRQVNTIIVTETDHPEKIEELLQRFHNVQIFSSLDLRSSFWQIELAPECRKYTAFTAFGRCFQFRRLPFGLNVSSAAFIRGLGSILPNELRERLTCYVDDILIGEESWEAHNHILNRLLNTLKQHGLTVNLEKSEFGCREIKFLGHIISQEGIKPDPEKMTAVRDFITPYNRKTLRGFLGLTTFYKKFVYMPSLGTPRLCALTGKNTPWIWDKEAEKEFQQLKTALGNAPLLSHPVLSKDFCMATDSAITGLGVVLFQTFQQDGKTVQKTIAFASRVLSRAEKNYSITELEALAVVWGFQKLRYFLFGRRTVVYTDHKALEFLLTAKLTHGRIARWTLLLQEYDFKIQNVPGPMNILADFLSRCPVGQDKPSSILEQDDNQLGIYYIKGVPFENFVTDSLKNIAAEQNRDAHIMGVKHKWRDKEEVRIRQHYQIKDDVLFHRRDSGASLWAVCLPDELVNKVIWYTHLSNGHLVRENASGNCDSRHISRIWRKELG